MSKPPKETIDYFPHFCTQGKTLFIIQNYFKNDGYAFWFKLLELLGRSKKHYFDCRNNENLEFLSALMGLMSTSCIQILDKLAQLDAIDPILWENRIVFSENFVSNLGVLYNRRSNKCLHKRDICIHLFGKCEHDEHNNSINDDIYPQTKLNYTKGNYIHTVCVDEGEKSEIKKTATSTTTHTQFDFFDFSKKLITDETYQQKIKKQFSWATPQIAADEMHRFVLYLRKKPHTKLPKTEQQAISDFESFLINSKHNPNHAA